MAGTLPNRSRSSLSKKNVTIIASLFHERHVNALIENAKAELTRILPGVEFMVIRVPGAFEIPSAASYILRYGPTDAVIALGVILKGATAHADLVAGAVTEQLSALSVEYACPVIHEVLLLENDQQAEERCHGGVINRGEEAGRAAANMIELFHKLRQAFPDKTARPAGPTPHIPTHG